MGRNTPELWTSTSVTDPQHPPFARGNAQCSDGAWMVADLGHRLVIDSNGNPRIQRLLRIAADPERRVASAGQRLCFQDYGPKREVEPRFRQGRKSVRDGEAGRM